MSYTGRLYFRWIALSLFTMVMMATANAQSYYKLIGDPGRAEQGLVAHRSPAGEFYIAGSVNDSALVQRVDAGGNVLWSRSFKPPGQFAKKVFHLSTALDGSLIGCGNGLTALSEPEEGFQFRMATDGTMLWVRHWNVPEMFSRRMVALDLNEYLLVGGVHDLTGPDWTDVVTARIDAATGDVTWLSGRLEVYSPVPYVVDANSMATIGQSHYVTSSIYTNGSPLSTRRVGLSKFDYSGQHLNSNYLLFSNIVDRRIYAADIIAHDDSLTIAYFGDINGSSANFTPGLIRLDTLGNIAWARDFNVGGSGQEHNTKVVATSFGYVMAGRTSLTNPQRLFLMAVSFSGNLLWTKSYGALAQVQTLANFYVSNLADLGDGFLLTGTVDLGGGNTDILLVRTDINGDVICTQTNPVGAITTVLPQLTFPSPATEMAFAATLDPIGSIMVDAGIIDTCDLVVTLGNDTALCGTLLLDAGVPGAIYEWQDGSATQTYDVIASGLYWVRVTQDCCVFTDSIQVDLGTAADIDLGPDAEMCNGDLIVLQLVAGTWTFEWSDASTEAELLVFGAGTYWVTATDGGCTASDTIVITTLAIPTADLGMDISSCDGSDVQLDPLLTDAQSILWSDGSDADSLVVTDTGTYWIQVGNQCGFASDTVNVAIVDPVNFSLGPDTVLCTGTNIPLMVTLPGWMLTWSDATVGNNFNITTGGTYWLDATNANCIVTDSIIVVERDVPVVQLSADTVVCGGGPLILAPLIVDVDDLLWSDSSTGTELIVTSSGNYSVTGTNVCGNASDAIDVIIVPALAVSLGPDTTLCGMDSLVLDLTASGASLLWSDGSTGNGITIDAAGTYWVEGDISGCVTRDSLVVTYAQLPVLDLGPDTVSCEVPVLTLDAGADGDLASWSNGSVGRFLITSRAGLYVASITNYCGTVMDTVRISFAMNISVLEDVALCPGKKVELKPIGQLLETIWNTGDTVPSILVGEGEYSYEATDIVGCPHTDSVRIYIGESLDGLVFIPNAFSPNGDGINEGFLVMGPERGEFDLAIFDRWGEELYRTDNPYKGWDGTYGGQNVKDGVYVYTVSYRDRCTANNTLTTRRGHVTVLR